MAIKNVSTMHEAADEWDREDDGAEKPLTESDRSAFQHALRRGLVFNSHDVEIQRQNPNSPLYSAVNSFEALSLAPELLQGLVAMGFHSPSKIQETALPALLAYPPVNMIAQSQSGTGKTAAFLLALLSHIDANLKHPQALVLAPTYELALQIGDVASKMAQFMTGLSISLAVRGQNSGGGGGAGSGGGDLQITDQVIIGTPGKMNDWIARGRREGVAGRTGNRQQNQLFDPKLIRVFVLDEADVMISLQGHQDQSIRIQRALDVDKCQMMLFSATYSPQVMDFAEEIVQDPLIIRLKREEESISNISQYWIRCQTADDKFNVIRAIYRTVTVGQVVVFCHTKRGASALAEKLRQIDLTVAVLSGDLTIEDRIKVLDRFRDGVDKVLITTNLMARGIDVEQVTLVVNHDIPVNVDKGADFETYLHRIGRTGRFGRRGLAFNLIDSDAALKTLKEIEAHFGHKIEELDATNFDESLAANESQ